MTLLAPPDRPPAVDVVAQFFARATSSLAAWTPDAAAAVDAARRDAPLTRARLDAVVEPLARRCFELAGLPVYGAGFVAALDLLADASSYISWWQGPQRSKLSLATQSLNKESLDYSGLEWYRLPLRTGVPHVAGPYVDYICSDQYTVTAAAPVLLGEEFVGVLALDILVDDVERELTPLLGGNGEVTVVNGVGRVIASTNPRTATGTSVRHDRRLQELRRFECEGVPLAVLVG